MQLSPIQLKKLLTMAKFAENPVEETFWALNEMRNYIETLETYVQNLQLQKGDTGAKGDRGEKGERGEKGADGINGKNGRDGRDGLNGKDGRNGVDGLNGKDGVNGTNGKDGSPDQPLEIALKLNTLEATVDPKVIKGWKDLEMNLRENLLRIPKDFDVRIGVSQTELKKNYYTKEEVDTAISGSTGTTGSIIQTTDTGDHQNFTLEKAVTSTNYYIILNNGYYLPADTDFGYTIVGTTLTFNSTLPSDLWGKTPTVICV